MAHSRWVTDASLAPRFYHVFAKGELEALLKRAGGLTIVQTGYDRDNWYAVGQKEDAA